MVERILDELQKSLIERTEQIIDQKLSSISEDLQKSTLNINKFQTSADQLSASVAENKKYMNEEHNETSSILKSFGHELDSIKKILLQKESQNLTLQKEAQIFGDDCSDLYNLGENVSTSYMLQKYNKIVFCNMETDGGGWLVIQRRRKLTNQVDFNRDWLSYKEGFGDLDTEFWIGNEFLHCITNQKSYELRIDLEDFERGLFYATYSNFRVGNEESGYQLHIGEYEGNATDSLGRHHNVKFTTIDKDNDKTTENCAKYNSGGF